MDNLIKISLDRLKRSYKNHAFPRDYMGNLMDLINRCIMKSIVLTISNFDNMNELYNEYINSMINNPKSLLLVNNVIKNGTGEASTILKYLAPLAIINILNKENNIHNTDKYIYINWLRNIDIKDLLSSYSSIFSLIELGVYNADEIMIKLIEKDDSYYSVFDLIKKYNVLNFNKIYNLSIKYKRAETIRVLDDIISNQV